MFDQWLSENVKCSLSFKNYLSSNKLSFSTYNCNSGNLPFVFGTNNSDTTIDQSGQSLLQDLVVLGAHQLDLQCEEPFCEFVCQHHLVFFVPKCLVQEILYLGIMYCGAFSGKDFRMTAFAIPFAISDDIGAFASIALEIWLTISCRT